MNQNNSELPEPAAKNKQPGSSIVIPAFIFLIVYITHALSPISELGDSMWSTYTAISIVKEGNTDIDEYQILVNRVKGMGVRRAGGHTYNFFPMGPSFMAVPFVFTADKIVPGFTDRFKEDFSAAMTTEKRIASSFIALSSVIIFLIAEKLLGKRIYSLLLTFIFAYCTSAWSTASRALWQHGPTILMLSIALYLIILARDRPKLIQYASIPLAFSYVVRPTNSVSIIFLSLFVLLAYRQYLLRYALWALPIAIPLFLYNIHIYGSLLSPYYKLSRLFTNDDISQALAGTIISPGRGILIFSPVILLTAAGVYLKMKNRQLAKLDYCLLAIIITHWIVISSHNDWLGGWAFGPRFFSDLLPYYIYFMIPFMAGLSESTGGKKMALAAMTFSLIAFSFFVNFRGATAMDTWQWNGNPQNISLPEGRHRVWDWGDLQFLRGL